MSTLLLLELAFVPLWLVLGALSGLTVVDPELAFRYWNIFQLRDVELSMFGVVLYVGGALLSLVVVMPVAILLYDPLGWITAVSYYGGAGLLMVRHWPPKW